MKNNEKVENKSDQQIEMWTNSSRNTQLYGIPLKPILVENVFIAEKTICFM